MKNRYRIVTDAYAGFEVQVKKWWFPFYWWQASGVNTHSSIDNAKIYIEKLRSGANVVWEEDPVMEAKRIIKSKV